MHGDSVQEAEAFLTRWRQARYLMYREGLIGPSAADEQAFMVANGMHPFYVTRFKAVNYE